MSENLYLYQATQAGVQSAKGRRRNQRHDWVKKTFLVYQVLTKERTTGQVLLVIERGLDDKNESGTGISGMCVWFKQNGNGMSGRGLIGETLRGRLYRTQC